MQVSISTTEGQFAAQLRLPRALVLSAIVTIAGAVTEAIRCEMRMHDLRAEIEQCEKKPATAVREVNAR